MKVIIIPVDRLVRKNDICINNLNLSSCGIPEDVHALQFDNGSGWIEYKSAMVQNESITSLPVWAQNCINVLDAEVARLIAYQASLPEGEPIQ